MGILFSAPLPIGLICPIGLISPILGALNSSLPPLLALKSPYMALHLTAKKKTAPLAMRSAVVV